MIQWPILMTVREVAEILKIQRAKVYILIETKALDGVKVGSDWRIRTESLERLIGPLPKEDRTMSLVN